MGVESPNGPLQLSFSGVFLQMVDPKIIQKLRFLDVFSRKPIDLGALLPQDTSALGHGMPWLHQFSSTRVKDFWCAP